jgi:hypothetical protein
MKLFVVDKDKEEEFNKKDFICSICLESFKVNQ